MRIALLTTARAWRGSGTSFTHIAQGLAARGHVLQLLSAAPAVTAELAARGLRARELPIRHSGFREARALARALDEFAADLVIADKPRDLRLGALASLSRMYIAYCDCRRPGEAMKIAACFTQGDSDYLMSGRNGVFYDRAGRDWDATIVRIVDNPISIRQAFLAPYKKFVRIIEEQVTRFAAAKEKEAEDRMLVTATVPP